MAHGEQSRFEFGGERGHRGSIRAEFVTVGVKVGSARVNYQPQQSVLYRQAEQRQTACIRNISEPHLSQITVSARAFPVFVVGFVCGVGLVGFAIPRL